MIDEAEILAIEEDIARILTVLHGKGISVATRARYEGELNGRCYCLRIIAPGRYPSGFAFDDAWLTARGGLLLPDGHLIGDDIANLRDASVFLARH